MAYTQEQLIAAYTAVHDGVAPDAAATARLQYFVNLSASQPSDTQAMNYILNSADSTTSLAILSYQFFTGKSPTKVGLDYLVNSTVNTADLNDRYYSDFNIENRYINFSANLGVSGEGAAAFATKYGSLSFAAYVASIYETIIGNAYATAAGVDPAKAIADIISRQAAILATAQSAGMIKPNATAAEIDIALKAATAGYLLGEAIKADVGVYASAANNFMVAIATGTAVYNTDVTKTYATAPGLSSGGGGVPVLGVITLPTPTPPVVVTPTVQDGPRTLRLTTGTDTLTGGAANDTFNADDSNGVGGFAPVFTAGDTLNGGDGIDTLTIVRSLGDYSLAAATVTNIEIATLTGNGRVTANVSAWTGLNSFTVSSVGGDDLLAASTTNLTLTAANVGTDNVFMKGGKDVTLTETGIASVGNITIGGTTPITGAVLLNITSTGAATRGFTQVNGGTTVTINQFATNAINTTQTNSAVSVNGSAVTTAVTVKSPASATGVGVAAVTASTVTITDVNNGSAVNVGKITTVNVDSFTTLTINDNALTSLTVARGSSNIFINNGGGGNPTNTTLAATLNSMTGVSLVDQGVYTTLNLTSGATNSTVSNIIMSAVTTLTLAGTSQLTLTSAGGLSNLQTVTVTGAAGIVANLSGATVTAVSTAGSTAASTVTINSSAASYTGGAGVDNVTLTANAANKGITLGGGNDSLDISNIPTVTGGTYDGGVGGTDVLKMTAAQAQTASGSGVFAVTFTNFERLELSGATNQTIDLALIGPYHYVTTSGGNGLTLNNFSPNDTLVLNGNGSAYTIGATNFGGATDAFNILLTSGTGATLAAAAGAGITATGVETLNIATADTQATPSGTFNDSITLAGNNYKSVVVTGNAGLGLTATSTALTNVDASGITLGGFAWTAGALAGASTVKGSATGANAVDVSAAVGSVAYTGGTGADTVTLNGGAHTANVSTGADGVVFSAATASATSFSAITGMTVGSGDTITFTGVTPTAGALGAAIATQGSLAATLNLAAASATGAGTPVVTWFVFGGDTYVVLDHSDNATFTVGVDYAVKLVGTTGLNLATSTVAASILSL